jgi:HTH-type transcriptional regulator/antitoxin HipB
MDYPVHSSQQLTSVLKGIRRQKGLSQADAGQAVGLPQSAISNFERAPDKAAFGRVLTILSGMGLELVVREVPPPSNTPAGEW